MFVYKSRFDVQFQKNTHRPVVLCNKLKLYTKQPDVVYNSADYTQQGEDRHKRNFLLI